MKVLCLLSDVRSVDHEKNSFFQSADYLEMFHFLESIFIHRCAVIFIQSFVGMSMKMDTG